MKKSNFLFSWLKALGVGIAITVIIIAVSALLVKNVDTNVKTLNLIMLLCKIASIVSGTAFLLHDLKKRGIIRGALFGIIYWAVFFAISVAFDTKGNSFFLFDLLFSLAVGALSGVIWANIW